MDFNDTLGAAMTIWRDGYCEIEAPVGPALLNRSGFVHGGVFMSLIDMVCARAGCWAPEGAPGLYANTLMMATSFVAPCRGGVLRAVGRRSPTGRTIFSATGEVFDDAGTLLALGQGTFRYRMSSQPATEEA